jgi:hypothetical protein
VTTCALCGERCDREQLAEEWQLCGRTKFAFHVNEQGVVDDWATTNLSHPKADVAVRVNWTRYRRLD